MPFDAIEQRCNIAAWSGRTGNGGAIASALGDDRRQQLASLSAADVAEALERDRGRHLHPVVLLLAADDSLGGALLSHYRQNATRGRRGSSLRRLRSLHDSVPIDVVVVDFEHLLDWFEAASLSEDNTSELLRLRHGGVLVVAFEGITVLELAP